MEKLIDIDLGIIFLHYNNIDDTIECVESFKNRLDITSYKLIIVDNCSPNGTGKLLLEKYKDDNDVEVVLSNSNLGNSGGLNYGLGYLRRFYNPKFVILSDNDVVLIDDLFYHHIIEEYERSGFAVLAPMIITPNGRCDDNPLFDIWYSRNNANYDLRYWKTRLKMVKLRLDKLYLFYRRHNVFIRKHKAKVYDVRKNKSAGIALVRRENIVPHGCFFILSEKYFECFDGLDDRSFMYAEEDIMYAHLLDKKLLSVYSPNVIIYHKGGSSVGKTYKENRKRKIFLFNNYIKAIESYLSLLDELGL